MLGPCHSQIHETHAKGELKYLTHHIQPFQVKEKLIKRGSFSVFHCDATEINFFFQTNQFSIKLKFLMQLMLTMADEFSKVCCSKNAGIPHKVSCNIGNKVSHFCTSL